MLFFYYVKKHKMENDIHYDDVVRGSLKELLIGGFAPVVILLKEFHFDKTGIVLDGLHFSVWSLLRHMHERQQLLLNFMKNPDNHQDLWPEPYWPQDFVPENEQVWKESIARFESDLNAMINIIDNPQSRLFQVQRNSKTLFWAAIANLQHNAYHIGQIKAVGRQLGVW